MFSISYCALHEQPLDLHTHNSPDDWAVPEDEAPARAIDSTNADWLNRAMSEIARGDRTAFAALYRATSPKLFGMCLRMLRDRTAAEDVLQDVYATVWRRADTFDAARANALTWLTTIARNRSIDRIRERHDVPLEEDAETALVDESPSPMAFVEQSQARRQLQACMDELVPQHRNAIRDAFYSGASYAELAVRANVPLGTMKSCIRRSLLLLKACLQR